MTLLALSFSFDETGITGQTVMKQKPTATSVLKQLYMHYSAPTCIGDILTLIIRIDSIPLISIRQLMMTGLDAVIMSSTVGYSG